MSMSEMKPCPFCGHIGLIFHDGSTFRWGEARCSGCDASAGEVRRAYPDDGEWHAAAIEQWNTRAVPADQVLVKRESLSIILDYIKGDCGHSQEDIFHAALSLQISLRAKA